MGPSLAYRVPLPHVAAKKYVHRGANAGVYLLRGAKSCSYFQVLRTAASMIEAARMTVML